MSKKYIIAGIVIFILIVIMAVLLLSQGGNNNQQTGNIELTWWKTFETSENIQDLISDYQQTHRNVTINYIKKDIITYEQDLLNAYASGNAPDILSIHNDWLPKQLDKLAPMPNGNIRDYKTNFVDVAADDFVKDNKIYGIPLSVDVLGLYYNKDILGSSGIVNPPKTWDELARTDIPKITKQSKPGTFSQSGIAFGTASNVNRAVDIVSLLMLQNGTQFYNPDLSNATFDQQSIEGDNTSSECNTLGCLALEFYSQFSNPAKNVYTWNAKADNSVDAFTQGKLAMMLSYYYMVPQIKDKGPNLNWGVAAVPQATLGGNKVNFANYWGESVNKNSANVAAAWDFLNFITSQQELTKYYTTHKQVSSRKDILETQISDPEIGVFADAALTAKSIYKKDAAGFETIFSKMIDDVSARGVDIEEAISNAARQVDLQLQNSQ